MQEFTYTMADVRRMWDREYSEQIGIMDAKIMEAMVKTGRGVAISYSGGKDSGMLLDRAAYCWRAL